MRHDAIVLGCKQPSSRWVTACAPDAYAALDTLGAVKHAATHLEFAQCVKATVGAAILKPH
jgi:hypothetical protein